MAPLGAEQLVIRMFSSLDGLANNSRLADILQDSRGFIWITTQDGVSRFDGQQFQNFSVQDGLGYPLVNKICETHNGDIWVGTNGGGVARYDPFGPPGHRFISYRTGSTQDSNAVNSVREGPDGVLWAAADAGVFQLDPGSREFRASSFAMEASYGDVWPARGGAVWAIGGAGLYRLNRDGSVDHWGAQQDIPAHPGALYGDRGDRIWAVTRRGALQIDPHAQPGRSPVLRSLEPKPGGIALCRILQDARGDYWISGYGGLYRFDGTTLHTLGRKEGVPGELTWGLLEDREGNLWTGVEGVGVMRVVRNRLTNWSVQDGLADPTVIETLSTADGIGVVTWSHAGLRVQKMRDGVFRDLAPLTPVASRVEQHPVLVDHLGDLWIATTHGIDRYRGGRSIQHYAPRAVANNAYETRSGDIWFLGWDSGRLVAIWRRAAQHLQDVPGLPGPPQMDPWTMQEDLAGNLWLGCIHAGLFRYRDGHFDSIPSPFAESGRFRVASLHVDDGGRTWIGYTRGAVAVVDGPNQPHPRIRQVEYGGGAVQSPILSLTSDRYGRLYVGSTTGLWLFDPRSGRSLSFAAEVPLLGGPIYSAVRDPDGNLWFGLDHGLVRLAPEANPFRDPPSVRLTQVRLVDGFYPMSGWGENSVHARSLPDWQNHLEFSFSGVAEIGPLRYQYRLEPRDRAWTATRERTVIYQQLSGGAYTFRVQSIDSSGRTSAGEADFNFEIAPHLWQRWWFLTLAALLVSGAVYALYRFRVQHLLAVEHVRMRIATDLHDDIGSALSHITLLSEVARRQEAGDTIAEALSRIASVSRETSASMSDIVWTINPQRDSLGDLSVRIRRFASELFGARDIDCVVATPESDESLKLGIEMRRQLLLVAKEAIHNVIRHAGSTQVTIELKQERHAVVFRIQDNGKGFDAQAAADGHGIASMRSRAQRLGGKLAIESGNGHGTMLEFHIPI